MESPSNRLHKTESGYIRTHKDSYAGGLTLKTYIVYHQVKQGIDCPDGIAAAWVAKRKYPDGKLLGWTYDRKNHGFSDIPASPGDRIVIVDFSFPASEIQRWLDRGISVEIIDHHKTALDDLSNFSGKVLEHYTEEIDLFECGATLAWETYFPGKVMPYWLHHVRDRDLWKFELPETDFVHEAIAVLRKQFATDKTTLFRVFDGLAALNKDELHRFLLAIGEPLVQSRRDAVKAIAEKQETLSLQMPDGTLHHIPGVRLKAEEDRYTSDVCMVLYLQHPDAPFVACITSDGTWSLRSDKHGNNTDVEAIAKAMGGGGHHNSAGFRGS